MKTTILQTLFGRGAQTEQELCLTTSVWNFYVYLNNVQPAAGAEEKLEKEPAAGAEENVENFDT